MELEILIWEIENNKKNFLINNEIISLTNNIICINESINSITYSEEPWKIKNWEKFEKEGEDLIRL